MHGLQPCGVNTTEHSVDKPVSWTVLEQLEEHCLYWSNDGSAPPSNMSEAEVAVFTGFELYSHCELITSCLRRMQEKPNLFRQLTSKTSSTGNMLLGQIKSLGGNKGSSDVHQSHSSPVVDAEDDEGSDGFSNVPLSSDEDSRKSGKSPQQSPSMMFGRPKSTGADGSGNHDDPHREGILGQIKSTTLSAGNAVVNTTKTAGSTVVHTTTQAGAALVGGLKATTNLLNPMNIGKPRRPQILRSLRLINAR
jgi:hypothetical protein